MRAFGRVWPLGVALVLLNWCCALLPPVRAQTGIEEQNASGEPCECTPSCEGESLGCHGRIIPREDCPCCKVCAQGVGSPCAPPALPCDTEFGYVCSESGFCEAEMTCSGDRDCPNDRFCLGGACVDPCPILTPCKDALEGGVCVAKDHRTECKCPDGTIENSDSSVCVPNNGTQTGCQYEGRLYAEGEVRYNGECQEQCYCGADGKFSCGPVKCPAGLFLAGQHSQEELCIELRNRPEADECCVVVVCANSLTHPSLLSSPASQPLAPISGDQAVDNHGIIGALSGRNVPLDHIQPVTDEEYQRRLKDLESELNKGLSGKKSTMSKVGASQLDNEKHFTEAINSKGEEEVLKEAASVVEAPQDIESTPFSEEPLETTTTLMPEMQDEEATTELSHPAIIVEYDDAGHEIHRFTVKEHVDVVTLPPEDTKMTTFAPEQEDVTALFQDVEYSTEPVLMEEDRTESAREAKMAPEESIPANESAVTIQEKAEVHSKGGLKILAVTHNTSTIVLPSTKGGDIYYKPIDGSDWQRVSVEAGQDSYVLKGLLPKTIYTLKWSGETSGSMKMTVETKDGCVVDNISYGVAQDWTKGCQERCSCRPGGRTVCQPRCLFLAGNIPNPLCTERPAPEDPECCVIYDCKKEEALGPMILRDDRTPGQPKLLVTEETHNSVNLAWDDFRPKTSGGGYVVEYREEEEVNSAGPDTPWMRKELPTDQLPRFTVGNLKPSTIYEVRVSIYDATDDTRPGESTETLTIKTKAGCMYKNESYPLGEFFVGCEERCSCLINGETKCYDRCSIPYFRVNSFKDDPLCYEVREEGDECCVIVQCASGESGITEVGNVTSFKNLTGDCTKTGCGVNAICVSHSVDDLWNLTTNIPLVFGQCQCLDGFIPDPTDINSCVPDPTRNIKEGACVFKSIAYEPGEVFYDECEYKCSCNNNTEIECQPRCEFPHNNKSKVEPGCEYKPDPEDSCCTLRVCNSTTEAATDAARSPSLISEGCTVGNVTYAKDQKFYKGCETQCICMGFGDVSCFPRCPPLKVVTETPKHCETLPDPEDSCCSITVCDKETPDVMKANITEMEREMLLMKERMKNMTEMEKEMLMKRMTELEKEMLMKNISELETILRNMIEKNNDLINSNITEEEKHRLQENMMEIEMMMRDVAEMEVDMTSKNLTDAEKETLKMKLAAMQKKLTAEMPVNRGGELDDHTLMHLLGVDHLHDHDHAMEHSHSHEMDNMKNHSHSHDDGTTHTHPGDHLPHTHDEDGTTHFIHTHEDGTTHSHPDGHLPHTHDEDGKIIFTHSHDDGTTHSHADGHHPHTHDMDMKNHTHTHDDGTTHTHPGGHLPHTHDENGTAIFTHTHDDGTTHSHPDGHLPHTHDEDGKVIFTHTHDDGTTHSHADDHHPHTHDMDKMENNTHTHDDGTTHTHPGGHLPHTHDENGTAIFTHTHDDGTTHSHPDGHLPHTHDEDGKIVFTHTHDDGTSHSHPDGHVPHTHDGNDTMHSHSHEKEMENHTHTHVDGAGHTHPDGHLPHTHDENGTAHFLHTHDDGTTHSHPDGNLPHTHDEDGKIIFTHTHDDMDNMKNHTHTHDDGTTHIHPGGHLPHSHDEDGTTHFLHTHEDGTTHAHPDGHLPHTHDEDGRIMFTHTHDDGTTHSHADGHLPHTHGDAMDDMVNHTHTHEDGTTHTHPGGNLPHTHDENGTAHFIHTHDDGTTHAHPDGHLPHTHDEDGKIVLTHAHDHTHEEEHIHDDHVDALHSHMHDDSNNHSHSHGWANETHHVHEDGAVHMHHDMPGWKNESHHMHDDGAVHMHHNTPGWRNDTHHMHEDGAVHMHHNTPEWTNDTHHMHEDGAVHMHHNTPEWTNDTHHMHEDGDVHMDHHHMDDFNDLEKKNRAEDLGSFDFDILKVTPVNATSVVMRVGVSESVKSQILSNEDQFLKVLYSPDSQTWMEKEISVRDIEIQNSDQVVFNINDLEPSTPYQFRVAYRDHMSSTSKTRLLDERVDEDNLDVEIDSTVMCSHNGRYYKREEEFYEGCSRACVCSANLEVHCAEIECPVNFGLGLIDPDCLEWDLDKDYVPSPPRCCPEVKCIQSAACEYQGQKYQNYEDIPREITGCSMRCTCNYGNVTCIEQCPPLSDFPPPGMNCAPEDAIQIAPPGELCCKEWQCKSHVMADKLIPRPHITTLDTNSAQLTFSTPSHFEGLPGELLVRYTNDPVRQPDPQTWMQDVIVPAGSTINHSKWEYVLTNLDPATQYNMQLMLTITGTDPIISNVFTYTTPQAVSTPPTTTPLPHLDIDAELYASEITKTSAKVSWRIFNDYELQYIDGVQVKYSEKEKLIPKVSQMFHRDNNQMDLQGLQPGSEYTVDLVFITHKNQTTTVSNTKPITFETLPEEDKYAFDIVISPGKITSQTAEVLYTGVPEEEEKYIHLYRVIYQREVARIESDKFKIAKSADKKVFLSELKPDTRYEVWLEAYLLNGRKKKSNVITITTPAGQLPVPEKSEVDPSLPKNNVNDYYSAFVACAIIAALIFLAFLGLLFIYRRKQNHAKAHINSSRNNAAYDNPSYKVGDNGYDMEMNGIKGSGNGATHMEDP